MLQVIRVLDEPTAAAVAYNLHKKNDVHHILVYDFGGGTLDVSLLFVSNGSVQVRFILCSIVLCWNPLFYTTLSLVIAAAALLIVLMFV